MVVKMLDRIAMSFARATTMETLALSPAQFGIVLSSFSVAAVAPG